MQTKTLAVILQRMLALFLIAFGIINTLLPLIISSMNVPDLKNVFLICILGPLPQITIGIIIWLLAKKIAGLMVNDLPENKLSFDIRPEHCYAIAFLLVGLFTGIKAVVILLPHISRIPGLMTPFLNPHNFNTISGWGMLAIGLAMTLRAASLGRLVANFGQKKQKNTPQTETFPEEL